MINCKYSVPNAQAKDKRSFKIVIKEKAQSEK